MNKKVMILFASAVLTASLAATGCGTKANILPGIKQPVAETQETTEEADEAYNEYMTGDYDLDYYAPEGKQANNVFKALAQNNNKKTTATRNTKKTTSKKTTKSTKNTKNVVKKAAGKTTKPSAKNADMWKVGPSISLGPINS